MTKITLKYSTKINKGSYKQVLKSNPHILDDWLDIDTANLVQKYKNMFEHKEKMDKINIEFHKIGISELKNSLKKSEVFTPEYLLQQMHDLFYDMGM
jgi:hypothetical protein